MVHLVTLNTHGEDVCRCEVMLDTSECAVTFHGGHPIPLTDMEARIVLELIRAKGAPVSKGHLIRKVWDGAATNDALAHKISAIRKKVGPGRVLTVYGYGYRISV